ncbi:MAG: hypothetical protein FJ161_00490 [Gammaproteobacteria bacterium]|nr:hypothetical protein [Gammaproteobacteria bacterium]
MAQKKVGFFANLLSKVASFFGFGKSEMDQPSEIKKVINPRPRLPKDGFQVDAGLPGRYRSVAGLESGASNPQKKQSKPEQTRAIQRGIAHKFTRY